MDEKSRYHVYKLEREKDLFCSVLNVREQEVQIFSKLKILIIFIQHTIFLMGILLISIFIMLEVRCYKT